MYETEIRHLSGELLESGDVEGIVGYAPGPLPLSAQPFLFRTSSELQNLIFNSFCGMNLARYLVALPKSAGRVAIVAKGCDARAITVLLKERQVEREKLFIIGVPCLGMLDRKRLSARFGELREGDIEFRGEKLIVRGEPVALLEFLDWTCARCRYPRPPLFDVLVGEGTREPLTGGTDGLLRLWELSAEKRWEFFSLELSRCIRCYACRNACPMCYCRECFVELQRPLFAHPAPSLKDNLVFHLGRAMHLGGRCVECGACERACPLGIPVALLTCALSEVVREHFAFEAGVSLEAEPPLLVYREDDPDAFIR